MANLNPSRGCSAPGWDAVVGVFLLVLTVNVFPGPSNGADQSQRADESTAGDEFIFRHWETDSGLPENTITGLAQTPDGYIWCATFSGVARFDGVHFEVFDPANTPAFPTDRITQMSVSRNGTLVMVSEFKDVVIWENREFKRCPKQKLWSDTFADDEAGRVWMFDAISNRLDCISREGDSKRTGALRTIMRSISIWIQPDGTAYASTDTNGFKRSVPGGWEKVGLAGLDGQVGRFYCQADGCVWAVVGEKLQLLDPDRVRQTVRFPNDAGPIADVLQEGEGRLWVAFEQGRLCEFELKSGRCREVSGLPGQESGIKKLLIDHEGNLWLGTYNRGLVMARRKPLRSLGVKDGLLSGIVRSVSEDGEGNLWVCTLKGINIVRNDHVETLAPNLQVELPWTTAPAGGSEVWLGVWTSELYRIGRDSRRMAWESERKLREANATFTFLFSDSKGLLWFGNSSGLFCFDGKKATEVALPVERAVDVRTAVEGKDGAMYVGSNGGGMFARRNGKWKHFGRADGLDSEQVYSLHVDAPGIVWIGTTGGGLARLNGDRIISLNRTLTELPRAISGIQSDDLGYLWLASTHGVLRIKLAELNDVAEGRSDSATIFQYGLNAGMPTAACTAGIQPSVAKARDGRIWFATREGLVCFNPREIPLNSLAPPVVIEGVSSTKARLNLTRPAMSRDDDRSDLRFVTGRAQKISVRPGADPIEFDFTGLSFAAPEGVRFRYRMEPLEKRWIKTSQRKAVYQRLPPGEYVFHVSACNNDGVWNEEGASLAIIQLPHYWETAWFKAAGVAVIALGAYGAFRYRMTQLQRVGQLRARIAADLHDEIGSNMGAVVLNSDLLKRSAALTDAEREQVTDIHRIAQNTAQAIREISWFINPDFDFADEMIVRMKEVAARVARRQRVSFNAPESPPRIRLPLEFRRNVMAIYKEALNNVVRHAKASNIEIAVELNSGRMELEVRDDGCGFDDRDRSAGQGLGNLRRRAEELGGKLEIQSRPGKGTSVKIKVGI